MCGVLLLLLQSAMEVDRAAFTNLEVQNYSLQTLVSQTAAVVADLTAKNATLEAALVQCAQEKARAMEEAQARLLQRELLLMEALRSVTQLAQTQVFSALCRVISSVFISLVHVLMISVSRFNVSSRANIHSFY